MMERAIACIKSGANRVDIEVGGHLLAAAMPDRQGAAPGPYDLLLASLCACTAFTLSQFAAARHWPLESLHIFTTLVHDGRGLHVERMLLMTGIDRACQQALLELAGLTPLTLLLQPGLPISTTLI